MCKLVGVTTYMENKVKRFDRRPFVREYSLLQRAYTPNVRLFRYKHQLMSYNYARNVCCPIWQYTNLFILLFVSEHCLRNTLRFARVWGDWPQFLLDLSRLQGVGGFNIWLHEPFSNAKIFSWQQDYLTWNNCNYQA